MNGLPGSENATDVIEKEKRVFSMAGFAMMSALIARTGSNNRGSYYALSFISSCFVMSRELFCAVFVYSLSFIG